MKKIFNKNKTKDWYLTADELIKYDVVDSLIKKYKEIFNLFLFNFKILNNTLLYYL